VIVLFTAAAEGDLEAVADWIAKDNPARARTLVAELREACVDLIFYRLSGNRIEVLHVLHGARDYEAVLFPKG
jgi:plasmid stabilization system protein ParE